MAEQNLLQMKWDISVLNKLIGMVFKQNQYITVSNLRNIQKLMDGCDYTMYQSKNIIMKRVNFLKSSLVARLDEKLEDEGLILAFCRSDVDDPVIEDIISNLPKYKQLNHREIEFLNQFVEDRLQFGIIQTFKNEMTEIIEKIDDGEYGTYAQARLMINEWVAGYNAATREISSSYNNSVIDLNSPNIRDRIDDVLKKLGTTSSTVITGIKMLNEMLSPGFRPGKLYMFLGLTGGFKSAMLLKIIIDCARFNANTYRPKKEGFKPVVLYLTMENTAEESIARMYNMAISNDDIGNHDSATLVSKMKDAKLVENDDMGILIMYKPNMSINTNDLRNIIEELDAQGKEVVLLSFDYIKRIRPQRRAKDEKEELKNVTNELRTLAIDYFIPVVTAHQMNRSGLATVNMAMRDNKADLARFLGKRSYCPAI